MRFSMDSNMQFPLVELSLNQGETVFIQRGSMVYHTPNVTLNTQLNASGSGLGRFVKAVGRSMVSGESTFITQAVAQSDNGYLALAPDAPGQVIPLQLGEKQYRLKVHHAGHLACARRGHFLARKIRIIKIIKY